MVYNDFELIEKSKVKFSRFGLSKQNDVDLDNSFGEIIHDGKLSWLARGAHLEIFSLKDGQRMCSYHFDCRNEFENSIITTVTEIECANENCCFLAVGLQMNDVTGSVIAIYSVQGSKILRCIEITDRITCCVHISENITKRTFLQLMRGCLAVGTDVGKLILLDINFKKCEAALLEEGEDHLDSVPCHMVKSTLDFTHIRDHYKHTVHEDFNFGIELEQVGGESFVLSLLPVPPALCLTAGLEDGRMVIYDLTELQILYIVLPQEHLSPLSKMTFLQPQDDPKAMIYVWAFHENPQSCFAVMHCLEYEKKIPDDNDEIILYEEFQTSHVKLVLTMNEKNSLPIRCQAITNFSVKEDDDAISICMLAWKTKTFTQILIFDMNQWYKEEMPEGGDWREHLTYLSPFRVKNLPTFDVYFDRTTVSHFNSVQRIEEHFYPISLTFDFVFLLLNASVGLHWPGLQYRTLDVLSTAGPAAISEPGPYLSEIKYASLLPQFFERELKKKPVSLDIQREILLSVALEYNCIGLLKNCARNWADGNYIGQRPNDLSLSALTDWIWKRAGVLKQRCNVICVCLFDYSGLLMDRYSKKELFHLTRQLKILADLLEIILTSCKQYIPSHIAERLKSELSSIRTASEYQEVLQWLLNIGLLPEGLPETSTGNIQNNNPFLVPYPYKLLNNFYKTQRLKFLEINHSLIKPRTNGCRLLYIDSFIEHKCNIEVLKEHWQVEHGEAVYPPSSMQSLLRTLLVPDVSLETKHALLIYAFLDLNMAVVEESYASIVQNLIKFPAVFKLNASLIKSVQAFWNLDHGQFEVALEEIVCPFLHERKLEQWEQELLIESLLVQENSSLALRALQAHSAPVNPTLELKVYVANNLISEAFHFARSKKDPELMQIFVKCCEYVGKSNILRDLALTEEEEKIVENSLKESKHTKPENMYLMYMLQKSKYIEAKTYLDDMQMGNITRSNFIANTGSDIELSKTLLSAYNSTMTPLSKNLNECYYELRNKRGFFNELNATKNIEKPIKPFSAELLKENKGSLTDGLFQSSILSVDRASNYWNEKNQSNNREKRMMQTSNVPFVRKPQLEAYVDLLSNADLLAYPETFKEPKKRRFDYDENSSESNGDTTIQENQKKRIRLMQSENFSIIGENGQNNVIYDSNDVNDFNTNNNYQSKDLLMTPIVRNSKFIEKERFKNVKETIVTPQSILKIKNLIRPNSPSVLRPVTISSSKPIEYEYTESETVSEVAESGSEINEKPASFDNVQETIETDDTLEVYRTAKSEQSSFERNKVNETGTQKVDSQKSEIDASKELHEKSADTSNSPTSYYKSTGRRSIRSNKSSPSESTNEFFSSVSTTDFKMARTLRSSDLKKDLGLNPVLDNSINKKSSSLDKEIIKDAAVIASTSSNLPSLIIRETRSTRPKLMGPTARRPLRRSETPPEKDDNIKSRLRRVVRSEEMSDSDAQCRILPSKNIRIELESKKSASANNLTQQPLSRIVAEKNLMKSIALPTIQEDFTEKTIKKQNEFNDVTEYRSDLYKTSTSEFNPLICSSKIAHTLSNFVGNRKKVMISEQSTVPGEISMPDITDSINPSKLEESILENSQNQHQSVPSLMNTVEVTSTSWLDTTKADLKTNGSPQKSIPALMSAAEISNSWLDATKADSDALENQQKIIPLVVSNTETINSSLLDAKANSKSDETTHMETDVDYSSAQGSNNEFNQTQGETYTVQSLPKGVKVSEIMESEDEEIEEEYEEEFEQNINDNSREKLENSTEVQFHSVIDISSDSDNTKSENSLIKSEGIETTNDSEQPDETSKSSIEFYLENSSNMYEDDNYLMDEIVTGCHQEIAAIISRPISVSSSFNSFLENSNEDEANEMDLIDTTVEEEIDESHESEEIDESESFENEQEVHDDKENEEENALPETVAIKEDRGNKEENVQETIEMEESHEIHKGKKVVLALATNKENHDTVEEENVVSEIAKEEKEDKRLGNEEVNVEPAGESTDELPIVDNILEDGKVSEKITKQNDIEEEIKENVEKPSPDDQEKPHEVPAKSSNIDLNKLKDIHKTRAESVDPESLQNNSLLPPKRSSRATSEQPASGQFRTLEQPKKTDKKVGSPLLNSPSIIMTRRRSCLLDRIEEENILLTPHSRKRHDSYVSGTSDTSFTLNVEPETSPSQKSAKKTRTNSMSSNTEDAVTTQTPSRKSISVSANLSTPRRTSRGASLIKELAPVEEEPITPTRRHSTRLSMHKDSTPDVTNDVATIKTRRNSMHSETSETVSTPRRTRATSSLRELVLTPRRTSRGASLAKDLSTPSKDEDHENIVKKIPARRNSRLISENKSTPKQLFKNTKSENNSINSSPENQDEDIEPNTSSEKDINKTEDYSMQRRLTRTQKSVMEKSANIKAADQRMIPLKKRQNRELDDSSETISPSKNDDTISVKSSRSRRSTTSKANSKSKVDDDDYDDDDNDDVNSTISSLRSGTSNRTPRKRKQPTRGKLKIISENDEDMQKNSSDVESISTVHSSNSSRLRNRTKTAN